MITMEMIAIGAALLLVLSVSFMIAQGLYYWGKVTQIGKKIERLAEQYEMAHNAAVSYLKSGDIEAYDNAVKLLPTIPGEDRRSPGGVLGVY